MQIISRKEAKELGLKRYFTGKPCNAGHLAERMVSNGACIICLLTKLNKRRQKAKAEGRGYNKEYHKEYYNKNKQRIFIIKKKYRKENANKISEQRKNYRQDNCDKLSEQRKKSRQNCREKVRLREKQGYIIRKRLIGGQALAKLFSKEIKQIYQNCPEGCDVDHIIALRGKDVCGLHVPWNLQYLEKLPNVLKGNKFDSEDESQFLDNRLSEWWRNDA